MLPLIWHFIIANAHWIFHGLYTIGGIYLYKGKKEHPLTDAALQIAGTLIEKIGIKPKPKAPQPPESDSTKNKSTENQ